MPAAFSTSTLRSCERFTFAEPIKLSFLSRAYVSTDKVAVTMLARDRPLCRLTAALDVLQVPPAPPVMSVVRPGVSEGEGRGFLGSFPGASRPTSMTPVSPADLDRTIRSYRFHRRHVGR